MMTGEQEALIVQIGKYRKPPTISPGLIYFRKRFLMGLYKGGLIYGWAYTWTIFCVSNKQVRHKQVCHKQGNKRVLSSDYWAYINWGTYIRGGLIFGWAYIRGGGGLYNKHTCREVSPGLDAPRVAATRGASNPGLTEPASMFGFYHMPFR